MPNDLIIPRLNSLIAEFNSLLTDVEALALGSGQVTQSQIESWNRKADISPESYRALTKTCIVGGSAGWFKAGEVELAADESYCALLAVQSGYTNAVPSRCSVLSVNLRVNAAGDELEQGSSELLWLTPTEYATDSAIALYDAVQGAAQILIKTSDATERVRISVIGESNAGEYTHLLSLSDNSSAELYEPVGYISSTILETVRRRTFASGDTLALPPCEVRYQASGIISELFVTYPESGHYSAWISFDTAAEGSITVTLPAASVYLAEIPSFGNSEHWELSIEDGVVAAARTV